MTHSSPAVVQRVRGVVDRLAQEVAKFGTVGLVAFCIDTALYNTLVFGVPGGDGSGPLHEVPLRAKIAATAVATVFAWLGNRYWTFRATRRVGRSREFVLFVVFNVLGLAIALACLGISRYALGYDSQLADNVSANGVGLVLGTLFRFWAYRSFVFTDDLRAQGDPLAPEPQGAGAIET